MGDTVDQFFRFYRNVGGMRAWGLSTEDSQEFRAAIIDTLKARYEQDGPLPVTVDRMMVVFRRDIT